MSGSLIVTKAGEWKLGDAVVHDPNKLVMGANFVGLLKRIADTLERHYPGWLWAMKGDEGGGIIDIYSERISAWQCYTLHTKVAQEDVGLKCVVRAGGEYLERFKFRRVRYTPQEWLRVQPYLGRFIPDVSDKAHGVRRAMRTQLIKDGLDRGVIRIATNPSIGAALQQVARKP